MKYTVPVTPTIRSAPADPMLMMRLSRITALGSTGGPALLPDGKRDPNFFRRINAFSALQLPVFAL